MDKKKNAPALSKLSTATMLNGITMCKEAFSWTCQPNINPQANVYVTQRIMAPRLGLLQHCIRQGSIDTSTSNAEILGVIWWEKET
jgi:hypothetical protein